jgi:hypothetical protein
LGCPQPGQVYAQVIIPGYLIHLQVGGHDYIYHTDMDKIIIFCSEDDLAASSIGRGYINHSQLRLAAEHSFGQIK